jgi:hypothetical protein
MQRYDVQNVTVVPVLVQTENLKTADGWGNFFSPDHKGSWAVHVVKENEIWLRYKKIFGEKEIGLFAGVTALRQAYNKQDDFALERACKYLGVDQPKEINIQLKLKDGRSLSLKSHGHRWDVAGWGYSELLGKQIESARLVMWLSDSGFVPALYCPDWKTAAYVMAFIGRIRTCPKCGEIYVGDEDYCKASHGIAYRTARSRWNAKNQKDAKNRRGRAKGTR